MLDNIVDSAPEVTAQTAGHRPLVGILGTDRAKKLLLIVGDVFVLYVSLFLTLSIQGRDSLSFPVWASALVPFTLLFAGWIVVFYIADLYEIAISKNEVRFYSRLLKVVWLNCILSAACFKLSTSTLLDFPAWTLAIFGVGSSFAFALWRYRYNAFVEQPALQRNVLVVGLNEGARELLEEIARNPQVGYRIAAVVSSNTDDFSLPGAAIYDDSVNVKQLLVQENISTVVTAFDPRNNTRLLRQLFDSLALKIQFLELPTFYERLTGKIPVNNIGHIWFLENLAQSDKTLHDFFKRALDLVFSTLLLLVALPFIPFVVLAIKLDSKGPVLFFQTRVGLLGRPFTAIKFRTMRVEAESDGVARWAQKNDPRITRVGRLLRKTRIDEIPQLWNVLRSEMSVIGPRPERPEFVRNLEQDIPFYNERHLVKPGLTGWAQVRFRYGSSVADSFKKLEYDFYYIKNRSIPLDVAILLKTVSIVLCGGGQ